jgi:hypothetical protein
LVHHPALDGVARNDAAQDMVGRTQALPLLLGQFFNVLQEHRALGQQPRACLGGLIDRPFQSGIAHIEGEKSHG